MKLNISHLGINNLRKFAKITNEEELYQKYNHETSFELYKRLLVVDVPGEPAIQPAGSTLKSDVRLTEGSY